MFLEKQMWANKTTSQIILSEGRDCNTELPICPVPITVCAFEFLQAVKNATKTLSVL